MYSRGEKLNTTQCDLMNTMILKKHLRRVFKPKTDVAPSLHIKANSFFMLTVSSIWMELPLAMAALIIHLFIHLLPLILVQGRGWLESTSRGGVHLGLVASQSQG